jgi:hypothetical protein
MTYPFHASIVRRSKEIIRKSEGRKIGKLRRTNEDLFGLKSWIELARSPHPWKVSC